MKSEKKNETRINFVANARPIKKSPANAKETRFFFFFAFAVFMHSAHPQFMVQNHQKKKKILCLSRPIFFFVYFFFGRYFKRHEATLDMLCQSEISFFHRCRFKSRV